LAKDIWIGEKRSSGRSWAAETVRYQRVDAEAWEKASETFWWFWLSNLRGEKEILIREVFDCWSTLEGVTWT